MQKLVFFFTQLFRRVMCFGVYLDGKAFLGGFYLRIWLDFILMVCTQMGFFVVYGVLCVICDMWCVCVTCVVCVDVYV